MSDLPAPTGTTGFEPTDAQREEVRRLARLGIPLSQVAGCVINPATGAPISMPTLRKHFGPTIRGAKIEANAEVAGLVLEHAKTSFPACKYWESARTGIHEERPSGLVPPSQPPSPATADPSRNKPDLDFARRILFLLETAIRDGDNEPS